MKLRSIEEAGDLTGKRVLLRAGFDLAITNGAVTDDFRIRAILPTMRFILEQGASLVIMAHQGRPRGEVVAGMSQRPLVPALSRLLGTSVGFVSPSVGPEAAAAAKGLRPGEALLLENLRFDPREEANDDGFSRGLAALGDLYVNEAFTDIHRPHASIIGVPKFLPSYAGLRVVREIEALEGALTPSHPALAIVSGVKFETKMPVMKRLLEIYDNLCVGGALANDFLKVKGYEIGISLTSDGLPSKEFAAHSKLLIPTDVVADKGGESRIASADTVHPDERIADIGPETLALWQEKVRGAKFVLWNGPLGIYEKGYRESTERLAQTLAESGVRAVVGGGDTIAALARMNFDPKKVFVSTGGGAMLEFLAKGTLPGLEPLRVA